MGIGSKPPRVDFGHIALVGAVLGPVLTWAVGWPGVGIWAVAAGWFALERYLGHLTETKAAAETKAESQAVDALKGELLSLDKRLTRIENRGPR